MQKKGQAAMEFLMTYGWAILAAIVVIGILGVYFFSSDVLTPKSAIVSAPFYANAWNAISDAGGTLGVTLEIKNNGGETYTISDVSLSGATVGGVTRGCTVGGATTPAAITAGSMGSLTIDCDLVTADAGEIFKGDITISYTKSGSNIPLTSSGSITESIV